MIDGTSIFNADKAYKDSKLCNVIFSRELYRRLKLRGLNIPIICWAPGLVIPRSKGGFFRYSRKYNELGQIVFSFIARDLLRITESVEKAGQILFNLAINSEYANPGFSYYSNRLKLFASSSLEESEISEEAKDDKKSI